MSVTSNEEVLHLYCQSIRGEAIFLNVKVPLLGGQVEFDCKTEIENVAGLFIQSVIFLLSTD